MFHASISSFGGIPSTPGDSCSQSNDSAQEIQRKKENGENIFLNFQSENGRLKKNGWKPETRERTPPETGGETGLVTNLQVSGGRPLAVQEPFLSVSRHLYQDHVIRSQHAVRCVADDAQLREEQETVLSGRRYREAAGRKDGRPPLERLLRQHTD